MKGFIKNISCFLCIVTCFSLFPSKALAVTTHSLINMQFIEDWLSLSREEKYGEFGSSGRVGSFGGGRGGGFTSNQPQKYYTTPTSSEEDQQGNVINYFRGGDTTTTKIIDSYNHTFNNIWNTNNTTNNYSANIKLNDFLNSYTTNNNNYTYNTRYQSWYYDNTQNTLNYSDDDTYYAYDNRQYFVSIDNSTDEYYLIDVQYSPTFVTVNYNYYNIDNSINYGDVTNIYYFELTDGRNSSTLTVDEVGGLALGYDVTNYELVSDDPNTLSLQHFDGNYEDSSSYGRNFHSVNRSTNYVDSGSFGRAVQLAANSEAGIVIPGLADLDRFSIEFRAYTSSAPKKSGELVTFVPFGLSVGNFNLHGKVSAKDQSDRFYGAMSQAESIANYKKSIWWTTYGYPADTSKFDASLPCNEYVAAGLYFSNADFSTLSSKPLSWAQSTFNFSQKNYQSQVGFDPIVSSWSVDTGSYAIGYSPKCETNYDTDPWSSWLLSPGYRFCFAYLNYSVKSFNTFGPVNSWNSYKYVFTPGLIEEYLNGDLVQSYEFDWSSHVTGTDIFITANSNMLLDEIRVCGGEMVTSNQYTPPSTPFDTNKVLALPNNLAANTIYVKHSTPVNGWRIGGVRPSNPATGFFYLPLHADYTGGQSQLYDGSNWVDVEAMVYDGSEIHSVIGYTFTPVSESPDVDSDLEPGRPPDPGEDVDQSTCTHTWEEASRTEPTCVLAGSVAYTCSKCGAKKTESIAKLGHTWEVKTSIPTTYDEEGNVVTQGYTIYKCSVCDEEYKDTDGTGPPVVESPDDSDGGGWFSELLKKIGEFFGTTIGALLELVGTIISKVLDSLITLVTNTVAKLTEVVTLFGSFSESMGTLWGWLPPEIVSVLVAGVTIIVFAAIIRLFFR